MTLPSTGNVSLIAHLDGSGSPIISVFANDTSGLPAGQGRLVVRHTAAAPALDVKTDGQVVFSNLSSPSEANAVVPAGSISAEVVPAGQDDPVVLGPTVLAIDDGAELIVYAVGSLDGGSLTVITEAIPGLGAAPAAVQTGTSPISGDGGGMPIGALLAIGTAGVLTTAALLLAPRTVARARSRRRP